MGCRIAAHLANAGIPTLLLDLPADGPDRNRLARAALDQALRQKPPAFFWPQHHTRVTPGNFEDDLERLTGCDWIIEAVAEDIDIKRQLLGRVEKVRAPHAVVSTNTSGLPIWVLARGLSDDFRGHFLGTHFFNPPRYLHLVEIIPGADTLPSVVDRVRQLCDRRLGKGVVIARDTPNFIANRIATFSSAVIFRLMERDGYSVEEIDALTGPVIGNPRSATFRTLDLVGLDVAARVISNLYRLLPSDPWREWFRSPGFVDQMLARGWLGDKSGQGFYRRDHKSPDGEIQALDWRTLEYRPRQQARFPSLEMARNIDDLPRRLGLLAAAGDRAASLLWSLWGEVFLYAASQVGEICDSVVDIDRAMRWGFAQELGPFQIFDVLGVESLVARLRRDGRRIPETVGRMLAAGARSFYKPGEYYDLRNGRYQPVEPRPGILILQDLKQAGARLKGNAGASLVDLGDGVLGVEFHSKMNAIGEDQIAMLTAALQEAAANFEALVVANQGENFSVGANLVLVLMAAQNGEWEDPELAIRRFQQANMALKYSPKPVVAAPFGLSLGGGCEILMHSARAQASAELYTGLVEVGVGVVPAAGGCKELLLRLTDAVPAEADPLAAVKQAFETIAYAKVSSSAEEARRLGFLRPGDGVSIHRERLLADAKAAALHLAKTYQPPPPRSDVRVMGESGLAAMELAVYLARQGGYITEYDAVVARKLAGVLAGGRLSGQPLVSEQYLLDLEREAFLSLCGNRPTQERMQHMLKTGKPLRN